jgi:hypothetical protein
MTMPEKAAVPEVGADPKAPIAWHGHSGARNNANAI